MIKKILPLIAFCILPLTINAQEKQQYQLSTHMLDIGIGQPASDIPVELFKKNSDNQWIKIASATTDKNGRIAHFLPETQNNLGTYKLNFATQEYFSKQGLNSIYPFVEVVFEINENTHYHIPITMSANGYSTYRGN